MKDSHLLQFFFCLCTPFHNVLQHETETKLSGTNEPVQPATALTTLAPARSHISWTNSKENNKRFCASDKTETSRK